MRFSLFITIKSLISVLCQHKVHFLTQAWPSSTLYITNCTVSVQTHKSPAGSTSGTQYCHFSKKQVQVPPSAGFGIIISSRHYFRVNSISNLQVIDMMSLNTEPAPDGGTPKAMF